ncbi:ABC transporter substrate-binding protein [Bradyrhizobium sp. STM 3809]|uniref:ABC transporter substrate-binding protein n=1 Tax=Bradyrhizobium sp. STM 3809 TaxID=551936 RepID=UPI000240933B|nr:ABC transporter substrate-binding protein [Bradyrhizobium sp. STM 3809]CCE01208.1 ABC sulfate transport system, periplasmic binding protein precursor [Bradyrhizobium sp. STM 3809]
MRPASPSLSRRSLLAGAALSALPLGDAKAKPIAGLEILGAPTGATISLVRALSSGALAAAAPDASFRLWRDTDDLRAAIVSGHTRLFSTPTHVPANLANRGMPLKLLCLLGMGHLTVVADDDKIKSFADLAGQPVLGFFRNDMPDLVFRACAKMEGLDPDKDIKLSYVQTGMEAAQMLASGRASAAILSEPPATAAIMLAGQQGRTLHRAINLQQVWAKHRAKNGIPMVGIAVHAALLDDSPELIDALRQALPQAREWVLANRADAAALADAKMQMRPMIFEKALDHFNMRIVPAEAARADLTLFYQTILDLAPDALAGRLPGDDFYLAP